MLKIVTPPTIEPVSVEEAKDQAVIGHNEDDSLIAVLISAARDQGEALTCRSWAPQTLEVVLNEFPAWKIELPNGPVTSITSVKYIDVDGEERTLASTAYVSGLDSPVASICPLIDTEWPETKNVPNAVRIRYVAGWTALLCPPALKQWILIRVASMYAQRESFEVSGKMLTMERGFCDGLLDRYIISTGP